jgi:glycosyltransferase involved in cell wall biosynthesis
MDVTIINPIGATPPDASSIGSLLRRTEANQAPSASALREVNIVELGAAIADLGHQVTVVLVSGFLGGQAQSLSDRLDVVPVHTLMPFPFHPGVIPMTPELLNHRATQEADVIHSGEFHQPSTFFAASVSLERQIPLILWQETFAPMRFPGSAYQAGFEWAAGPKIRAAAKRAVPRTRKAAAYLRALGISEASIAGWIPTGVDVTQFAPRSPHRLAEEFGWNDSCDILLLVARMSPTKGIDSALRALKRLLDRRPNVRLLVRGSGPMEPELRALARDLGVSDFVRFLPRQSRVQMIEAYNLAKIVLSTSRTDLMPFALIEASACGRPVVATDVGAVRDVVVDGQTGTIVPPEDEARLVDAIDSVLRDEGTWQAFARAARERAIDTFNLADNAKRLVEAYRAAAN